jgi:hypothetical protein
MLLYFFEKDTNEVSFDIFMNNLILIKQKFILFLNQKNSS